MSYGRVRRWSRGAVIGGLVGGLALVSATPASADYYKWGLTSTTFSVKVEGLEAYQVGYFDTSRTRWNNNKISNIGRSQSAYNTISASSYNETWYGQYTPVGVLRTKYRTFRIRINEKSIHGTYPRGANREKRYLNTMTHELGHALSLADNPNTTQNSIMTHRSISRAVTFPQAYDISEVKRIYG